MKRKTSAIPIRRVDFSESSQIVALFTREYGLVEGIAKGAYRPKSSFQGPFELCVLYEVLFVERRAGLSLLTESTVLDGFRGVRTRWSRYVAALHVLELVRAVATAGAVESLLFDLAVETLRSVSAARENGIAALRVRFDALALRALGLLAPINACVACGRVWPGGNKPAFFSRHAGGLLCIRCRASTAHAGAESLAGPLVRTLGLLTDFQCPLEDIQAAWDAHGAAAGRVISGLRNHLLERDFM